MTLKIETLYCNMIIAPAVNLYTVYNKVTENTGI